MSDQPETVHPVEDPDGIAERTEDTKGNSDGSDSETIS